MIRKRLLGNLYNTPDYVKKTCQIAICQVFLPYDIERN